MRALTMAQLGVQRRTLERSFSRLEGFSYVFIIEVSISKTKLWDKTLWMLSSKFGQLVATFKRTLKQKKIDKMLKLAWQWTATSTTAFMLKARLLWFLLPKTFMA
jgi:hypothetical protein